MKMVRLALVALAAWFSIGAPAQAAEFRAFSTEAFAAAQAEGRPIVVQAHANWCPTCRAQAPILRRAASGAAFEELIVFTLDFDRQTAERRALGIRSQSTLIAFDGRRETRRSVGDTNEGAITALLRAAIE